MGWLSWLFPSPEDRVVKARALLAQRRFVDARDEVEGLTVDGAAEVLREARQGLTRLNLEAAVSWAAAGEDDRAREHLELAASFHEGGLEEEFRKARGKMRASRDARTAAAQAAAHAEQRRLAEVHPEFASEEDDGWMSPEDAARADELKARVAFIVDGYPEALRGRVQALGSDFLRAVIDLEDGRPDLALPTLAALPDDDPLVCFERSRVALAGGDPIGAARFLEEFARLAGGHQVVRNGHTGELLARLIASTRSPEEALRLLREVRRTHPDAGAVLYPQLLEATGDLPGAERELTGLIQRYPKESPLYAMLARVRLAGDRRFEAMQALEASLQATFCAPGKCGYRPPDLDVHRMLATLYLEEGKDPDRGLELADIARSVTEKPGWADAYLLALASVARQEPEAGDLVRHLWEATPGDDPRRGRLERYLPAPA